MPSERRKQKLKIEFDFLCLLVSTNRPLSRSICAFWQYAFQERPESQDHGRRFESRSPSDSFSSTTLRLGASFFAPNLSLLFTCTRSITEADRRNNKRKRTRKVCMAVQVLSQMIDKLKSACQPFTNVCFKKTLFFIEQTIYPRLLLYYRSDSSARDVSWEY